MHWTIASQDNHAERVTALVAIHAGEAGADVATYVRWGEIKPQALSKNITFVIMYHHYMTWDIIMHDIPLVVFSGRGSK